MDADDRRAIGIGAVRLLFVVALILMGALTAGLALRLFQIVSGV